MPGYVGIIPSLLNSAYYPEFPCAGSGLVSPFIQKFRTKLINPRPAGVWLVTRPAGGGAKGPPWDLPNYWTDFQISNAIR